MIINIELSNKSLIMNKYFIFFIFISNFCLAQIDKEPIYKKNDLRLDLKLPHINSMSFNPKKEYRADKIGFNGYGIGLEYNYSEKRFVETSFSLAMTFELPFPAPLDREHSIALYSYYISLTDNIIVNKFTFGYGVNYAVNQRNEVYRSFEIINTPLPNNTYDTNRNLGLTLQSYYKIGKTLNLGLIYRPSVLNLNNKITPIYEHLISLELNWRIPLSNLKGR